MRILFVSNFYPPARPGGYTQWCQEVAEGLEARGHEIAVLTSQHQKEMAASEEQDVYRLLDLESNPSRYSVWDFFIKYQRRQKENGQSVRYAIKDFRPDLAFVWGMWLISKNVPAEIERRMGDRVVYYLSDYWPTQEGPHVNYWTTPPNHSSMEVPKRLLGSIALRMVSAHEPPELQFRHPICVSEAVQRILSAQGVPVEHGAVIHGGSDLRRFSETPIRNHREGPIRLLYAGQVEPHKGVHTAIEAAGQLVNGLGRTDFQLEIVGGGSSEYLERLERLVQERALNGYVRIRGLVPKTEMPSILARSDILVFPSIYEEPFARMPQEAMAAGLAVVGTETGGTPEILRDGETGLAFHAEDAGALALQLKRLMDDRDLRLRLARAGRNRVHQQFTLDRMVDRIEKYLTEVLSQTFN